MSNLIHGGALALCLLVSFSVGIGRANAQVPAYENAVPPLAERAPSNGALWQQPAPTGYSQAPAARFSSTAAPPTPSPTLAPASLSAGPSAT